MVDTRINRAASLPDLLAHRARDASDGRLALDLVGGCAAALAILLWRPPAAFLLLAAAVCFAAFGAWGIADRELGERPPDAADAAARVLRVGRGIAAAVGAAAGVALLLGAMRLALGTWIS